ncbi:MAG: hypothetical protein ABR575_03120 [Actinomycetota bacterium]
MDEITKMGRIGGLALSFGISVLDGALLTGAGAEKVAPPSRDDKR